MTYKQQFLGAIFTRAVWVLAACTGDTSNRKPDSSSVVVPPVVVPVPELPAPKPPPPVVVGPQCHRDDSLALRWARELTADGYTLTTHWYDSAGAWTAKGLNQSGCLAGYMASKP